MIDYKSTEDIEKMRVACKITRDTLDYLKDFVKPGVSTLELDKLAHDFIVSKGAKPTFKNYNGFPGSLCTSINEEIVHGIPNKNRILKEGDIISLDVGAKINGFTGEVINVGLKSTKIKAYTGEIMILANHLITDVVNYNLSDSLALIDIDVAYDSDIEKVEKVLTNLCEKLSNELPHLKGKVELLGINSLEPSSIRYRMTVVTESMKHHTVQRQMRKEVKLELDKHKIVIPYNQVVIHNG